MGHPLAGGNKPYNKIIMNVRGSEQIIIPIPPN